MTKFLDKVLAAVRRSKEPRRTMVGMILKAHGWRQPWRTAAWYPPKESVTFGAPITVEDLKRRGYVAEADHLMSVENMLMNWASGVAGKGVAWTRR